MGKRKSHSRLANTEVGDSVSINGLDSSLTGSGGPGPSKGRTAGEWLKDYVGKFRGRPGGRAPPFQDIRTTGWSAFSTFIGLLVLSGFHYGILGKYADHTDLVMMVGSQGASAVLLFDAIGSPMAQPRNVIFGNLISSFIGVSIRKLIDDDLGLEWLAVPLTVSTAIVAMELTKTLHPPGGGAALIAVIGSKKIVGLGYLYCLCPVLAGELTLLLVALLLNNIPAGRQYPVTWFGMETDDSGDRDVAFERDALQVRPVMNVQRGEGNSPGGYASPQRPRGNTGPKEYANTATSGARPATTSVVENDLFDATDMDISDALFDSEA